MIFNLFISKNECSFLVDHMHNSYRITLIFVILFVITDERKVWSTIKQRIIGIKLLNIMYICSQKKGVNQETNKWRFPYCHTNQKINKADHFNFKNLWK